MFAPSVQGRICKFADMEHATTVYRDSDAGDGTMVFSQATALITPRRSLAQRLSLTRSPLQVVDEVIDASLDCEEGGSIAHPILAAREKAISEVLFKHLAVNCPSCPIAESCNDRGMLAKEARKPSQTASGQ
jgi:hypothetical protein